MFTNYSTGQWSPTFLAQETGFVEDNFSTDQGGGQGETGGKAQAVSTAGEEEGCGPLV